MTVAYRSDSYLFYFLVLESGITLDVEKRET
jgi:hypothetical protein